MNAFPPSKVPPSGGAAPKSLNNDELRLAEETVEHAMAMLPWDLTAAYFEARGKALDVLRKESDPRWFLR